MRVRNDSRALQFGLRLVDQLELAVGYVGIGFHYLCKPFYVLGRYYADFACEDLKNYIDLLGIIMYSSSDAMCCTIISNNLSPYNSIDFAPIP